MKEMRWNQYEYAELNFYKDIEELNTDFSDVLTATSTVSVRTYFWVVRDYIGPDTIKPILVFNDTVEIPSNIIFAIGVTFSKHFLEW